MNNINIINLKIDYVFKISFVIIKLILSIYEGAIFLILARNGVSSFKSS